MSAKTDKDEKTKPKVEVYPSPVKIKVLPQWRINLKEGRDVDER